MSRDIRDTGTVSKWNADRGFGFIKLDGGCDVFVHLKGTRDHRPLSVGERVSFFVAPDPKDASRILAVDAVVMRP